jgi:glycosyltransferase involved in cell wall biosynthesis
VGNFVPPASGYGSVSEELAAHLEEIGWHVVRTSYRARGIPKLIDMLRTCWTQRAGYHAAHVEVYSGKAFVWAEAVCALLRSMGKPYVLGLHGGNLPAFLRGRPRRASRLLSSASAVVCPSRYLQESLCRYRPDAKVLPNALASASYPRRLRRPPKPVLVWLRAFRAMYQPELAVETLARVCREIPEARLLMAGPDRGDKSKERARERAIRLRVQDRVEFLDGVAKQSVASFLNRGDIFLNTSGVDNTPVSVMEALTCGLCVVSTNVGGMPCLLRDQADALLVDPGDAGAMAQCVLRIVREPGLAERLSANAMEKSRTFDWSVVLPQWDGLLLSVQQNRAA